MAIHTSASISLQNGVLRFAEVVRDRDASRLVRLGSCTFDFDLEDVVRQQDPNPGQQATLRAALSDIFAGSSALDLHITLHPRLGTSLFVPLPASTPPSDYASLLQREVALVLSPTARAVASAERMRAEVLPDGEEVHWFHVLALPGETADRIEQVFGLLSFTQRRLCLSTGSAAAVLQRIARKKAAEPPFDAPYRLAIGLYPSHTELTLCRNQSWHFGASTRMTQTSDTLYFAAAMLHRLGVGVRALGGLYLYGSQTGRFGPDILRQIFRREPQPLNPLEVVDYEDAGLNEAASLEQYAPCIGAALRDVYP